MKCSINLYKKFFIKQNPNRSSFFLKTLQNRFFSATAPLPPPVPTQTADAGSLPNLSKQTLSRSSMNAEEVAKFAAMAETWWDFEGPVRPLHLINPTRLTFIRSTLCRHFGKDPYCARPFEGLNFVDVGCGGGIVSEPLARMGAKVTGIDAAEENIKIARVHADSDPLTSSITYSCTTAEQLVRENQKFDAVISLEIPKGTHEWSKFLTPEELVMLLQRASISVQEMAGFVYDPPTGKWSLSDDISMTYIAYATKQR